MMPLQRGGAQVLPGQPLYAPDQLWERSRLEWRRGDHRDPGSLIEDFLVEHGLQVRDLANLSRRTEEPAGHAYGATLFLSAAGAARLAGMPAGPASPVPAVPDLVIIAWGLAPTPEPAAARHRALTAEPTQTLPAPTSSAPTPASVPTPTRSRAAAPDPAGLRLGQWRSSWTQDQHAEAVAKVRAAIARGDVYQVNVVGHAAAPYQGDPLPGLRRVTALPGARYAALLHSAPGTPARQAWAVACASPETLLEIVGGTVRTRPIKGTRPATAAGRAALLASAKERAEHIMIVDLERNDLARIARTGTVQVEELYAVRRWCDLWQAESVVSARLSDGIGLVDLLRAVSPGGSVTGAPKRAALELIAGLEPVGRGPSMGVLGWIGQDRVDLGLTIRTVAADAERVHLWAGGGITWGSDPADEVAEAAAKAAPIRVALAGATGQPLAEDPRAAGALA